MSGSVTIAALSRQAGVVFAAAILLLALLAPAAAEPVRLVVLGDSLSAGYGLAEKEAFPVKLHAALKAKGHDVEVINAGVSGDTASGGLARLDWSVPDGTDAVILELGANDALRAVDPSATRKALDETIRRLKERKIEVLLTGMQAPPNMGGDYRTAFNRIYPELAKAYGVLFYPFFLDGVAAESRLNQRDGIHPTAEGVDVIVARILPSVEKLIALARANRKN
jgi:acyl-CoA thioesterase-1